MKATAAGELEDVPGNHRAGGDHLVLGCLQIGTVEHHQGAAIQRRAIRLEIKKPPSSPWSENAL